VINRKLGFSAALLIGSAVAFAPAAQADPALDRAQDRGVEHYKRSQGGAAMTGGMMGDAMKAGQRGDGMKSGVAKGDPLRAGAKGGMAKK